MAVSVDNVDVVDLEREVRRRGKESRKVLGSCRKLVRKYGVPVTRWGLISMCSFFPLSDCGFKGCTCCESPVPGGVLYIFTGKVHSSVVKRRWLAVFVESVGRPERVLDSLEMVGITHYRPGNWTAHLSGIKEELKRKRKLWEQEQKVKYLIGEAERLGMSEIGGVDRA